MNGSVDHHSNFSSNFVTARQIDIWCPPNYADTHQRFPVIYMHDGQNIFDQVATMSGESWQVHEAVQRLMAANKIDAAIVVGVWCIEQRRCEYMPQKIYDSPRFDQRRTSWREWAGGDSFSDRYLKFLVEELKPFVDSHYRTQPDQTHTFVMGSSMGGLISLYAINEYPQVFGGAACLSTHWLAGEEILVDGLAANLPTPANHKLYFDFGTAGLDEGYEPYQRRMDEHLRQAGYIENKNWLTCKFEGADHNEKDWRERVEIPLRFLLG